MFNFTSRLCSMCQSHHIGFRMIRNVTTVTSKMHQVQTLNKFMKNAMRLVSGHVPNVSRTSDVTAFDGHGFNTIHRHLSTNTQHDEKPTFDAEEVQKFTEFANNWWDEGGEAAALHTMNRLRIPFIRDGILQVAGQSEIATMSQPLKGITLLDIGCGGGVVAEALARLGANVTGIDALAESIDVANWHAAKDPTLESSLNYQCCLAEDLVPTHYSHFDAVVASEVIEHVANPEHFVSTCCSLVKPGGSLFFTTMNKTPQSYLLAVLAAEYVFRVVPAGTHDWNKFIPPENLKSMLKQNGCHTHSIHGMTLNPLTLRWCWITDTGVNYALHATKPVDSTWSENQE